MRVSPVVVLIAVSLLAPALAQTGAPFATEEAKLTAPVLVPGASFGEAVAMSEDRAVVGVPRGDAGATLPGVVHVYVRSGSTWTLETTLAPSDLTGGERFGTSVDIDGDRIIVGAPFDGPGIQRGSAYVFVRSGGTWTQEAKLAAPDGGNGLVFGSSVAISGDRAAAGSPLYSDGGSQIGSVYTFSRAGGAWAQTAKITLGSAAQEFDYFGTALDMSGDRLVVGAPSNTTANPGRAFVYQDGASGWALEDELSPNTSAVLQDFGAAVALDGGVAVVGDQRADLPGADRGGAVFVFGAASSPRSAPWFQFGELVPSAPADLALFGGAVAVTTTADAGLQVLVGAESDDVTAGAAYLHTLDGSVFAERARFTASDATNNARFGSAVAFGGSRALIGARAADAGTVNNPGAAYVLAGLLATTGEAAPSAAALSAPRPNPTRGAAALSLTLDAPQAVRATLHDALGRTVAVLHDGVAAGTVALSVDARGLAPGVYLVRVAGERLSETRRLTVAR